MLPSLSGLPWYAAAAIIVLSVLCTKGIDALLKLRKSKLEERQYEDGQAKAAQDALVAELKEQVKELKADMSGMLSELKDVRTAHTKCEVQQAELRGELNVMKEKVARLESHDEANRQNKAVLKDALKKVDPDAAADIA